MIRDSGSVKLIWSFGSGTASAGAVAGGPFSSAWRRAASSAASVASPLLQLRLGLLDLRQPALPPRQLFGKFIATAIGTVRRILSRIGRLGLGQQPRRSPP